MEINKLTSVTLLLVLVALIVGIGVVIFDKFGEATRNEITVVDETVAIDTNAGTLAESPVKVLTSFSNSTVTFTVGTQVNVTLSTGALVTSGVANGDYDATYTYYDDSATTTVMTSGTTAVGGIATNWFGLIVTIVVLALILGLVIRSFGVGGRR